MKWFRSFMIITMVLALFLGANAQAGKAQAALPPQCTGFQLQNTNTTTAASVSVLFYTIGAGTGVPAYTFNLPDIGASKSNSYYLPSYAAFSTVTPGSYSLVVSSSEPLITLVNQQTCTGSSPFVLATSAGASSGDIATTVYVPYVLSRAFGALWSSALAIQNAGSVDSLVTVNFFPAGSSASVQTNSATVKAGESWFIPLDSGTYATPAMLNFRGAAAVVSASAPVAVVETRFPANASLLISTNGSPVAAGSQKLFTPQVTKAFAGFTSGLTIYNPNPTSTPIAIDYTAAGSTTIAFTQSVVIPANSPFLQYLGSSPTSVGLPTPFNGTAVVRVTSGTNKVFGVADISSATQSGSLSMIPFEQAATTLYLPQVTRQYFGYTSGWQVVNTSANTLTLTIEYWKPADTTTPSLTETKTLNPKSALTNYVGSAAYAGTLGVNWNGGAIIRVTGGTGSIVGQVNFVFNGPGDGYSIYGAFPPPTP